MTQDVMGRVHRLLLSPAKEWEVIDGESADVQALYRNYVAPLVIFSSLANFIGAYFFTLDFVGLRPLFGRTLTHAILSVILGLAMVYVFALIVDALAPSFGAQKNFGQAFKLAAYAPTAYWIGAIFMLIPILRLLSAIAALYTLYLLFVGLPKLMKPAPDKGIVYTGVAILCMVGLALVVGSLTGNRPFN